MGFALSNMTVSSSDFQQGGEIPEKYTGEGADVSPQLSWTNAPQGTQSFAIICHDPDAPLVSAGSYGFVHWVLYNLPGSVNQLDEKTDIGVSGKNNFGNMGYGGPMPPEGHGVHHYFFWVLALDQNLQLEGGLTMAEFLTKAEPHVIGMNRLVGTYRR